MISLTRKDKLRRVILVCRRFTRNLAYYRVGMRSEYADLFDHEKHREANFWRMTNSNSMDLCVLEWCKLFVERRGKHHGQNVVTSKDDFRQRLFEESGVDDVPFQSVVEIFKHYRDKFVAHLDLEQTMTIPRLDIANKAVHCYQKHILEKESEGLDLGFTPDLNTVFEVSEKEAVIVYSRAISPHFVPLLKKEI